MSIHLEFNPTFKDYLSAQRLHAKRNWWSRLNDFAARKLNPALGVLILILAAVVSGTGVTWNGPFVFMIVCASCLLAYPFYIRNRLKSCYKRTRMGDGSRILDVDEHCIKAQESHVRSEFEWSAIQFVREDKDVMMLYVAPAKFMMIPKRCCAPQELDELKRLYHESARPSNAAARA